MGTATGDQDLPEQLRDGRSQMGELLRRSASDQQSAGYYHTLQEICQQPRTWRATAAAAEQRAGQWLDLLAGCRVLILAGSGSSQYVGDCLAPALLKELRVQALAVSSGGIVIDADRIVPPCRPCLMVSLARSGDSPESTGAVEWMLEKHPDVRHLVLTCNARGRLAQMSEKHPRITVLTLDDATNDRSLVMTSSFTNIAVAGRFLGMLDSPQLYRAMVDGLAAAARGMLLTHGDAIAGVARGRFSRAIFLGSGCRYAPPAKPP
jgi:tagatose-6-phosphate ketose/aldose isomerase